MTTIPASELVRVIPNVLNAGGDALDLIGLILTSDIRVPMGEVLSFPNDGVSVANFFGPSAVEVTIADTYFDGFRGSIKKPENILFTQYPFEAVEAYLRGGPADTLTLPELKAISGSLSIVVDGYTYSGAPNLSAATSFSSAAAIIETALNASIPNAAVVTGSIAAGVSGVVTASIAGNVMTVSAVTSGVLHAGALLTGTGVTAGTKISSQLSGTAGGIGTYAVTEAQIVASTTVTGTFGVLTVTAVTSGTLSIGQVLSGSGVTANTTITELGTGEGLTGTYFVDLTQTAASTTVTAKGGLLDVDYDSVSGAFTINSSWAGSDSTIAFATGAIAASLFLTEATGATLSQGAYAQTPSAFMTNITQITQNWATFMLVSDPDGGSGNTQKLAFATWSNDQDKRWLYVARDTDITPTQSADAAASLGNILLTGQFSGTMVMYDPTTLYLDAFVCGAVASIDFEATNGRITLAYRGQEGLIASVTTATAAGNLISNGYNFYGAYATANEQFLLLQPGQVSGEFQWADSYVNQIWLNNALQLALLNLLSNTNSVPYNNDGYELIKAACLDPINAGLNFGAIRANVTLSAQQAAQVNNAAGSVISDVLTSVGWYLQVLDAAPQVRQARESPPINFWYMDGQSVQKIVLNSVLVQ